MGSLILMLIVGGVVGWLASMVMKTNAQMGVIANVVVGIVGSALGSWLFGIVGPGAFGTIRGLVMVAAGRSGGGAKRHTRGAQNPLGRKGGAGLNPSAGAKCSAAQEGRSGVRPSPSAD